MERLPSLQFCAQCNSCVIILTLQSGEWSKSRKSNWNSPLFGEGGGRFPPVYLLYHEEYWSRQLRVFWHLTLLLFPSSSIYLWEDYWKQFFNETNKSTPYISRIVSLGPTLKIESIHNVAFLVIGGTRGCHNDNFNPTLTTKLTSWQLSVFSVLVYSLLTPLCWWLLAEKMHLMTDLVSFEIK